MKRRHQGFSGNPADWSNRILTKHRPRTQVSKVGDQKHWSDIKDGGTHDRIVLDRPKTGQGPRSSLVEKRAQRNMTKIRSGSLCHRVATRWDIVSLLSGTWSSLSQSSPVQRGLEMKSHRASPSFLYPRRTQGPRRNINVLPLPNLINNPSMNEPKAKLGIGYVFRPSKSVLDSTST